jgi:hypothetical protein
MQSRNIPNVILSSCAFGGHIVNMGTNLKIKLAIIKNIIILIFSFLTIISIACTPFTSRAKIKNIIGDGIHFFESMCKRYQIKIQ